MGPNMYLFTKAHMHTHTHTLAWTRCRLPFQYGLRLYVNRHIFQNPLCICQASRLPVCESERVSEANYHKHKYTGFTLVAVVRMIESIGVIGKYCCFQLASRHKHTPTQQRTKNPSAAAHHVRDRGIIEHHIYTKMRHRCAYTQGR